MAAHPTHHASAHRPRNWLAAAFGAGGRRLWAQRWTFGVPMATLLLLAALYAVRKPDVYTAEALVRAVDRSIGARTALPEELEARPKELIEMAFDRMLTVGNLNRAAELAYESLTKDEATPPEFLEPQLIVDRLSARPFVIEQKGQNHFVLAAVDTEPELAAVMVNAVLGATMENEKQRLRDEAEQRLDFIEEQKRQVDIARSDAESALRAFDRKNEKTLPERAVEINQEIVLRESELRRVESELTAAEAAIRVREQELQMVTPEGDPVAPVTLDQRRSDLRREYANLDSRVKETRRQRALALASTGPRHPEVLRFDQMIEILERDLRRVDQELKDLDAEAAAATASGPTEAPVEGEARVDPDDPRLAELFRARDRLRDARERLRLALHGGGEDDEPGLYAQRATIPVTASQRQALVEKLDEANRDYEARSREFARAQLHDEFVTQETDKVLPYMVERAALPPIEPSGPNRPRFLLTGLAIGAALGYGLVLLRKKFHMPAVRRAEDIYDLVTGAMIVSVPLLPDGRSKKGFRFRVKPGELALAGWVLFCLVATAVLLGAQAGSIDLPNTVMRTLGIQVSA